MEHNKYMNNFDYNQAILLMKQIKFLTNNFLIILENHTIPGPVSVLNFEYYTNLSNLLNELALESAHIQCIVSGIQSQAFIPFGRAQQPGLMDYADGADVMNFLENLSCEKIYAG